MAEVRSIQFKQQLAEMLWESRGQRLLAQPPQQSTTKPRRIAKEVETYTSQSSGHKVEEARFG